MITFHIGHILIDLLEQIYSSMLQHYGEVRADSLIVVDVAGEEERAVLGDKLLNTFRANRANAFGAVFRALLADKPLVALQAFAQAAERQGAVFADLHLGLDLSQSFYYLGYRHHPCILSLHPVTLIYHPLTHSIFT
jgi:hypothetical protein